MASRRYALVTGASSGIGAAMAQVAAARGLDVGLVARRADRLEALAAKLRERGAAANVFEVDLSTPGAALALANRALAERGRIDVLVNNAGSTVPKGYAGTTFAEQQAFIELTVTAPSALAHAVLPGMLAQRWGRIINIASVTALSSGGKGNTLYPAGKSFLLKFSQSLNAETRARGVYVTAVLPGFVATEFQEANGIPASGGTRRFAQTAGQVAREAWKRNDRGHEIVVPGVLPKLAAALMRGLPEPFMRSITRSAAEKYYVGE